MYEGWIKIDRKLLEWEWYKDANTIRLFLHLLLKANFKDTKYMGMLVERGSLITKISELSEQLSLSKQQIRTSLEKLKKSGIINTQTTNKFTVVTIVNYTLYQESETQTQQINSKQLTNEQQTSNKQITRLDKERKNEKNDKNNIINYTEVVNMYNEICISLPKVRLPLSDTRKRSIKARLNKYSLEDIKLAFEKTQDSDFLKGANDKNWIASFDWIMKDANISKILEGNYNNKGDTKYGQQSKTDVKTNTNTDKFTGLSIGLTI